MALLPGARLGPYEIVALIGAGGMGEVYRARDERLKRDVALKILPADFAADPERLARFQREAEVLAALNDPHISQIYGLEPAGAGGYALVMEFVEGDDLSQRIGRGGVPLDEALAIAKQVADALEAAHARGIIHRDLKPANIKLRPDGTVKVLDFGLAKLAQPEHGGRVDITDSPTLTSPTSMTGIGVLLGTAAYMSPEQAKGHEADKRSDIWAFGCLLYELLTGRGAFTGDDVSDTLANVLKREPDLSVLADDVPPAIHALVQRCLAKDRRQRIADLTVVQFLLNEPPAFSSGNAAAPRLARQNPTTRVLAIAAAMLLTAVIVGAGAWWLSQPVPPSLVVTAITTSDTAALVRQGGDRDLAITPDGSRIVYRGKDQLIVRALNRLEPTFLTGIGTPRGLFISPSGESIGFFDGNTLRRVSITGGPPTTVTAIDGPPRGATWGPGATIVFATDARTTGLQRVADSGGEPTVLTTPDREQGEGDHRFPEFLPGGEAVLFTITSVTGRPDDAQIAVLDLGTGKYKTLMRGSHAYYVPTGHLVYGFAGTLRAAPFDLPSLEVEGASAPVRDGVTTTFLGAVDAVVATNGSLAYIPGGAGTGGRQTIVSVDREGRPSPLPGVALDSYRDVRVSPDGKRLALATQDEIWIYDFERQSLSRLTGDSASETSPLWTRDAERIIFTSNRAGYPELFSRRADGTGSDEPFLTRAKDLRDMRANGWSADGALLLFTEVDMGPAAVGEIAIGDTSATRMLLKNDSSNDNPTLSPDGQWIAYQSNDSGQTQIYVERYPQLGSRQPISTDGGRLPLWAPGNGRELFFSSLDGRQMLVAAVQPGARLVAGRPRVLFDFPMLPIQAGSRPYDITPSGQFLILRSGELDDVAAAAPHIILLQNWFEELKRLVPVN